VAYGEYHISIGRTIASNIAAANGDTRCLADAIQRGMKLVTVDPRCSPEASKGEWVPIRPGGDLAFVLGLINTMLYEIKTLDIDFLTNRTNGPYLVAADGSYLRNGAGKPQMFDTKRKKVVPFDAPGIAPLLEGEVETPAGKVKTGFTLMKESMKQYTPEWAEKQSTVPAATIRRIAKEFVAHAHIGETITLNGTELPLRPAALTAARGSCNHQDGTVLDLAGKIVNELVGALDVPGGCLACISGPILVPDENGTVTPFFEAVGVPFSYPPNSVDLSQYFPYRHSMPHIAYQAAADPNKYGVPYKVDGALLVGGCTVNGTVQPELMAKSLSTLSFVATIAYNYDENVALADIVLPDHAILERMEVRAFISSFGAVTPENLGLRMVMFRDPVPPMYNTRQSQDIYIQLLARMGQAGPIFGVMNKAGVMMGEVRGMIMAKLPEELQFVPGQKYTMADIWDRGLKAYVGPDKGVEWFKQNGVWSDFIPKDKAYNYSYYPMGKTRYQIYFEGLRAGGQKLRENFDKNNVSIPGVDLKTMLDYYDPIPKWRETALMKDMRQGPKDYDLLAFSYKVVLSNFRLGGQDQLPWLMEVGDKLDPYYDTVCINSHTAAAKGLREGQMVWVESQYGKTRGRLHASELFHPETVGMAGALGRMVNTLGKAPSQRTHYNRLLDASLTSMDLIAGGVENTVRVKVYAA
jgi:anaerobic selenocysteine-containing dehydrogenase